MYAAVSAITFSTKKLDIIYDFFCWKHHTDYIRRWVAVGQTIQAFTNIPVLCQHQ